MQSEKSKSKDEIHNLRSDLKEQVLYVKAIETEKNNLNMKSQKLESQLKEVKKECAEAIAVKDKIFNESTLDKDAKLSEERQNAELRLNELETKMVINEERLTLQVQELTAQVKDKDQTIKQLKI